MAKTTPSGRAKSKTKAPKKKPTQLDRIERSIGLIESKLATLNAWETLQVELSEAKLASSTVAVEEKWVPKVGEWIMASDAFIKVCPSVKQTNPHPEKVLRIDGDHFVTDLNSNAPGWHLTNIRPATPEEIAAHEAKVKAEAQAVEDAKLVFGARVECEGREWYIASITPDKGGHYLIARTDNAGLYMSWRRQRNEFTLLP